MPRMVTHTWRDDVPTSVTIRCGHCTVEVEALLQSDSILLDRSRSGPGQAAVIAGGMYVCPRHDCGKPSLVYLAYDETRSDRTGLVVVTTYPRGSAEPMDGLPEEIQRDRLEAWSCFHGGDNRAAVIMGRAAIQRAVRSRRAKGRGLKAELADLAGRQEITQTVRSWADEVRIAGDDAAHPEDLGEVTTNEAIDSLEFMDAFLSHAIALPAKADARKAARKKPTGE